MKGKGQAVAQRQPILPKKSFYALHSEPKHFFGPSDFSTLIADPEIIGLHISPKGRAKEPPCPSSLYAWAVERFGPREGGDAAGLFDPAQRLLTSPVIY